MFHTIEQLDIRLFYWINQSGQTDLLDFLMPFISNEKNFYIPLALVWIWLLFRKGLRPKVTAVAIILLIGFSEMICTDVIKPAIGRLRPYDAIPHVRKYNEKNHEWRLTPDTVKGPRDSRSMPSAHATNIFAAAWFLSYYFRHRWPWLFLVAITVAYSRIYLGVHFPMDVVVGAFTGTGCALLFIWATNQLLKRVSPIYPK